MGAMGIGATHLNPSYGLAKASATPRLRVALVQTHSAQL